MTTQPNSEAVTEISIIRPDDWHLHLRDGAMLKAVAPVSAASFSRAIVMPNLVPPVRSLDDLRAYRSRIAAALPGDARFRPLMTLYLTETTDPSAITEGAASGELTAVKLYPAGATTNSDAGVKDVSRVTRVLEAMQAADVPLLVHGEVTDPEVDIFDREAVFIERVLAPLRRDFPALRIVMEHITTQEGASYVGEADETLAATITPQHLIINRTDLFKGGIRPHLYCLPIAKRENHRQALRRAATSGSKKFFLGTDSAPHLVSLKECACGCAGIFNAPVAIPYVAQVFDEEGALDRLEGFVSRNGPAFYRLPVNENRIRLRRAAPDAAIFRNIDAGEDGSVVVFRPDRPLEWSVVAD
ncbi:dihydroorotase [Aurantimonas sp. 22II-16-19i]|uniref:dihydroorotase n=1 Tax=Aurantimonas sp. 22II-16-19i TaxID=1317114 RepID=UPI0009F7F47C|nr:dihydroorotase [Aurantimonas sp. 22II-16-19i]ORE93772.1 dihydroorotase [Aurantimonas sp. 22II-16-19i]